MANAHSVLQRYNNSLSEVFYWQSIKNDYRTLIGLDELYIQEPDEEDEDE